MLKSCIFEEKKKNNDLKDWFAIEKINSSPKYLFPADFFLIQAHFILIQAKKIKKIVFFKAKNKQT